MRAVVMVLAYIALLWLHPMAGADVLNMGIGLTSTPMGDRK